MTQTGREKRLTIQPVDCKSEANIMNSARNLPRKSINTGTVKKSEQPNSRPTYTTDSHIHHASFGISRYFRRPCSVRER
jgi:hypothetical protein